MRGHQTLMSSAKHDWRTPRYLFDAAQTLAGGFDLDAAADTDNHLCPRWLGPGSDYPDAIVAPWVADRVWCNPPYGRELWRFAAKAVHELRAQHCGEVWMLVPARTDTSWWSLLMPFASRIYFHGGRIRFETAEGASDPAPFPSALIVLGQRHSVYPDTICVFNWRPEPKRNNA